MRCRFEGSYSSLRICRRLSLVFRRLFEGSKIVQTREVPIGSVSAALRVAMSLDEQCGIALAQTEHNTTFLSTGRAGQRARPAFDVETLESPPSASSSPAIRFHRGRWHEVGRLGRFVDSCC